MAKLTELIADLLNADRRTSKVDTLTGGTSQLDAVVVTAGGSGYTGPFAVGFTGGGGSGAAATATVVDGAVVSVEVTAAGSGYTSAPTVDFLAGGGSGATGTALLAANDLDGIATAALTVPVNARVTVSDDVYGYQLQAGTDAEDSPQVIRPDDYAASTNEKVWKLMGLQASRVVCYGQSVMDDDAGAASTEAMLTIRRNMVVTSGSSWAFVVAGTVEPPSASTAATTASYFTINTTNAAGNITAGGNIGVSAGYFNPGHTSTTYTLNRMTGIYVLCTHGSGAANLGEMNGLTVYLDCAAASTTDLARQIYLPQVQRSGGADTWWSIYQAGSTDDSYFAGKLIISDDDTSADETFSTDGLALHVEGAYGSTSKAAVDIDAQNTYTSGTGSATTVGAFLKARYTGNQSMNGSDNLIAGYCWARQQGTHTGTSSGHVVGMYARAEVASTASTGTDSVVAAIRCRVENAKSGHTVTNGYGLYVLAPITTGTFTNLWGIYQAGSSDHNYLAGTTRALMVYGHVYMVSNATATTISGTGTFYAIGGTFTSGQSNGLTPGTTGLTVVYAGRYMVHWQMSFTATSSSQDIEGAVMINTTAYTSTIAHRKIGTGSDSGSFSGVGCINLSASDVIKLSVRNNTSATNVTVEHAQIGAFYIGH